ncbi:hypothetical protein B0H34DRAFT_266911 [Crassisporium funariophilum]|nr:hypothetical protein B0H34DRAFT_266911 [Crassisporium funariophilum]
MTWKFVISQMKPFSCPGIRLLRVILPTRIQKVDWPCLGYLCLGVDRKAGARIDARDIYKLCFSLEARNGPQQIYAQRIPGGTFRICSSKEDMIIYPHWSQHAQATCRSPSSPHLVAISIEMLYFQNHLRNQESEIFRLRQYLIGTVNACFKLPRQAICRSLSHLPTVALRKLGRTTIGSTDNFFKHCFGDLINNSTAQWR